MPQGRRMTRPYRATHQAQGSQAQCTTAQQHLFSEAREPAICIVAANKPGGPLAVGDIPPWRQPAAASSNALPLTVSAPGSRTRLSGREQQPGQNSLIACGEEAHLGSSDRLGSWSSPEISMLLEVFCRRARAIAGRPLGWDGTTSVRPLVVNAAFTSDMRLHQALRRTVRRCRIDRRLACAAQGWTLFSSSALVPSLLRGRVPAAR